MIRLLPRQKKDAILHTAYRRAPQLLFKIQHLRLHWKFGKRLSWPNIAKPKTFNEHILARKLNEKYLGYSRYADKELVKNFIADEVGEEYVIPTILVISNKNSVDNVEISGPCVIKATHLSSAVILLDEGERLSNSQRSIVKSWFSRNLYRVSGEMQYRDILPRIIVEHRIGEKGRVPHDYKIFCWKGKVGTIQVDVGRFTDHRRDFFDSSWHHQPTTLQYPRADTPPPKPKGLSEMIWVAETIAKNFDFVRVDLYEENDKIYFGELTFHPGSGYEPFTSYQIDLEFGHQFER